MPSLLYRGAVIHSATDPFAQALLVDDGVIAWIGSNDTADGLAARADRVIDLQGALIAPAFVDAHTHILETGFAMTGVDLSPQHTPTLADALVAIHRAADTTRPGEVLVAFGWDELAWPEQRAPHRTELDAAAGDIPVYAARADVHSAVVSSALATACRLATVPGWDESGWVTGEAHHVARDAARDVDPGHRELLYRAALNHAAASGIVSVHEMSAPHIDTRDGLRQLLSLTTSPTSGLPHVAAYRGELCHTTDDAHALLAGIPGLVGIGGDLNVDGSIGSRTAAMRHPYTDAPRERGMLYLSDEQIAAHLLAVQGAGSHAGFHVIGDRAMDQFVAALHLAAGEDRSALRAAHHRVEHALFIDSAALAAMLDYGVMASIQPAFDAHWGGPGGMYATRLGTPRSDVMSPFADLNESGVPLALGSDAPVTPFDPWGAVLATMTHCDAGQRLSARAAFRAHTRGGWRFIGQDHTGAGQIRVGAPAHLAVWHAEHYVVQSAGHGPAWSTDARAGTPLLPELGPITAAPQCLQTLRAGEPIFDTFA